MRPERGSASASPRPGRSKSSRLQWRRRRARRGVPSSPSDALKRCSSSTSPAPAGLARSRPSRRRRRMRPCGLQTPSGRQRCGNASTPSAPQRSRSSGPLWWWRRAKRNGRSTPSCRRGRRWQSVLRLWRSHRAPRQSCAATVRFCGRLASTTPPALFLGPESRLIRAWARILNQRRRTAETSATRAGAKRRGVVRPVRRRGVQEARPLVAEV
mmetsp:Transcript_104510/g.294507  ORF Transcript_104510/g.294507 Transcript_104510/m.294507 type:complete len:213 (+) Transcript_104510:1440-2078(+)